MMSQLTSSNVVVIGLVSLTLVGAVTKCLFLGPRLFKWAFPLHEIPGPFLAQFTRLWLWRAFASINGERIFADLDRTYGRIDTRTLDLRIINSL
jgi:hypothetical protein